MNAIAGAEARTAGSETPDALDRLQALVAVDLVAVNTLIVERMQSPVALIPQLAGYLVASGGKRIRPMLTLAAARLCGLEGDRHIGLAAAVEFIHTATLLHDDVVDESGLRRGQASANVVFGNQASVLVGDFLFARAFQVMVADGSLATLAILSDAAAVIAEGEVLQLSAASSAETTRNTYMAIIRAKTAALFAAACEIGAVVAGRPDAERQAMRTFGLDLGIAFQLIDDVLDYSAHQATLGKSIGDDFRDGKMTLPAIIAMERGSETERAFWRRAIGTDGQRDGDLDEAQALIRRHGALEATAAMARQHGAAASAALAAFPASTLREALDGVVAFCIGRDY